MSRTPSRPTKVQTRHVLTSELDTLVGIDTQRNTHQAALALLQSQRDTQVGRMQILAEQAGIDLEEFVAAELARRQASG